MRLAFKSGFYVGGIKAALMTLTKGAFPGRQGHRVEADAQAPKRVRPAEPFTPDGKLTFRKVDAVFKAGQRDARRHPLAPDRRRRTCRRRRPTLYEHMCPAGVYERQGDKLVVNAPNCVDCKATDVLGPRWTPREGGSGPRYRRM